MIKTFPHVAKGRIQNVVSFGSVMCDVEKAHDQLFVLKNQMPESQRVQLNLLSVEHD